MSYMHVFKFINQHGSLWISPLPGKAEKLQGVVKKNHWQLGKMISDASNFFIIIWCCLVASMLVMPLCRFTEHGQVGVLLAQL